MLSERKEPCFTLVKFMTELFQVIVGKDQPQKPTETLSILTSILTFAPIGSGLGPNVMLEVLADPDCTALITAPERPTIGETPKEPAEISCVFVDWLEMAAASFPLTPKKESEINDSKTIMLIDVK